MSKNCVDAVLEFNLESPHKVGLLPSRRQIECTSLGGGYVNDWNTHNFCAYVNQNNTTLIQRDHAGPNQGNEKDDGRESLSEDIFCGINLIHIDPWKKYDNIDSACNSTLELMRHCLSLDKTVKFEVGTEEAIRSLTALELNYFLRHLKMKAGSLFDNIIYAVVQSGTSVIEDKNIGNFNPLKSKEMCNAVSNFNLIPKEHNSDYLSLQEIRDRMDCGVVAFNIAPEFGVLETKLILKKLEEYDLSLEKKAFINTCFKSKKWSKWVQSSARTHEYLTVLCGHYNFTTSASVNALNKINEYENFSFLVKEKIKKRFKSVTCLLES